MITTIITEGLLLLAGIAAVFILGIHWGFRAPREPEQGDPSALGFAFEQVWIPGVAGKRLFAWFLPVRDADQTLIILHGWGGNAEVMLPIAAPFHQAGLNVLLFDARNHGRSDGHGFSSLPRFAEDLASTIAWLQTTHPESARKLALLGHSVGAGAVLLEASRRDDIAAVISVSAFAHPEWVMQRHLQRLRLPDFLIGWVNRYVQWVIGYPFASIAPINRLCKLHCPLLLVHGTADSVVPIADAHALLASCPSPTITLLEVADAGHASVDKIEDHGSELLGFLKNQGFSINLTPAI